MKIKETDREKIILKKEGRLTARLSDLCDYSYSKKDKKDKKREQTK